MRPMRRYCLYLENTRTGERQEMIAKHADMLSRAEARRAAINCNRNAIANGSDWRCKIEEVSPG
jgi:hypothetical protein